jgi:phage baseplate assembly protein W
MPIPQEPLGRGWAFPFRFDPATGRVALSSSEDNIRENIGIILGTKPGERQMAPDFGCRIHELLFAPNTSATAHMAQLYVKAALARFEPRIRIVNVRSWCDPSGSVQVEVQYCIPSIGSLHTLAKVVRPGGEP